MILFNAGLEVCAHGEKRIFRGYMFDKYKEKHDFLNKFSLSHKNPPIIGIPQNDHDGLRFCEISQIVIA